MARIDVGGHKVENLPLEAAYLIQDFITSQEEAYLLSKIEDIAGIETTLTAEPTLPSRLYRSKGTPQGWREVNGRRLMQWGGQLLPKSSTLIAMPLPKFMTDQFPYLSHKISECTGFFDPPHEINHVLVNEYLPGQGIMPHEDGPAYTPIVTTLSLGSHTVLDIYNYESSNSEGIRRVASSPLCSIFLPARSLFVMKDDLYEKCLHGIAERAIDSALDLARCANASITASEALERSRRVSLTMRRVPKVRKLF